MYPATRPSVQPVDESSGHRQPKNPIRVTPPTLNGNWIGAVGPGTQAFGRPPLLYQALHLDAFHLYAVRGSGACCRIDSSRRVACDRLLLHGLAPRRDSGRNRSTTRCETESAGVRSGKKKPRTAATLDLRALRYHLTTEACAATMQRQRSWDASDTSLRTISAGLGPACRPPGGHSGIVLGPGTGPARFLVARLLIIALYLFCRWRVLQNWRVFA